jgi:hypothetical protein
VYPALYRHGQEFKYSYFGTKRWLDVGELPAMEGILYANVINKCWSGWYASMEALQKDIHAMADG